MVALTVLYRNTPYVIDIDPSKKFLDLKTLVSERTKRRSDLFSLQIQKLHPGDSKLISDYIKYGTEFTMVNVRLEITVMLNDKSYGYTVGESHSIGAFANDIIGISGLDTELTLYYNDLLLQETSTFVSCNIPNNSILTAVAGADIKDAIRHLTITHRNKSYLVKIEKSKTVLQLKNAVSETTGIRVDHFCLKFNQQTMYDTEIVSTFNGTNFTMDNVTINVNVILNGIERPFFVNEMDTIDYFKTRLIRETGTKTIVSLENIKGILNGTNTIRSSGVENNSLIIATMANDAMSGIRTITVTYREESYPFEIDISNTVLTLKKMVSVNSKKDSKDFSLKFYWILLNDAKPISNYVKFGTKFIMSNVIIHVTVKLETRAYGFNLDENITVEKLRTMVNERTKIKTTYFHYQGRELKATDSLIESEIEDGGVILATSTIFGGDI